MVSAEMGRCEERHSEESQPVKDALLAEIFQAWSL